MRTAQDQIKQEKSDQRWNDIPRGTMDEVSSYVRLNLPSLTARPLNRLFHLVFESHHGFYEWSRSDAQEQAWIQNRCVNQTTVDGTLRCHCSYHHHLRTDDSGAIMTRRCEKRMSVASDRGVHE